LSDYNNDYQQPNQWVEDIRQGRFADAEERLLQAATARVEQMRLLQEAAEIVRDSGSRAELYVAEAGNRAAERAQRGEFQDYQAYLQGFREELNSSLRQRGYNAQNERVHDYVQARRAAQEEKRQLGSQITPQVGRSQSR
jgi:hypothetical protein